MKKITLFLLGFILTAFSLVAQEPVIKITTNRSLGDSILLTCQLGADPQVSFEGAKIKSKDELYEGSFNYSLLIESKTILLKGNIIGLICIDAGLTEIKTDGNQGLQELFCSVNKLTHIDVSKNENLSTLVCENNQLTSLDVTHNPNLLWLDCGNNQLTSLDVSKNHSLTTLYIGGNKFKEMIDISKNENLLDLSVYNLGLEYLDLSNAPNLYMLSCFSNKLKNLDLSNQLYIGNVYCFDNQLETIKLSPDAIDLNTLYLFQNRIKGASMRELINSVSKQDIEKGSMRGMFVVVNSLFKGEDNSCTEEDVKCLEEKNWDAFDARINPDSLIDGKMDLVPYKGFIQKRNRFSSDVSLEVKATRESGIFQIKALDGPVYLYDRNGSLLQVLYARRAMPLFLNLRAYAKGVYLVKQKDFVKKISF